MTEDFLHYVWKFKKFDISGLATVEGENISAVDTGIHNFDAGPDFSNARLYINEQLWAGNVEIHVRSSDWCRHNHQTDRAYDNVILHVVYEHDHEIFNSYGVKIPTLELKGRLDEMLYWQYENLLNNPTSIPCAAMVERVSDIHKRTMMERVWVERMEQKSAVLADLLGKNKGDWNETFYQWICRAYGLKVNSEPMLILARNLPLPLLLRHKESLFQLECMLLGVSGLLEKGSDEYCLRLRREFNFVQKKYNLPVMQSSLWKFSRLRPVAFPGLRLARFAAFVQSYEGLLSMILSTDKLLNLVNLFSTPASAYWQEHYRLGKKVREFSASAGEDFIHSMIINVIVPFFFLYGKVKGQRIYREKALSLLSQMRAENNAVSRLYRHLNFPMDSALDSQAAIQLNSFYCKPKKCLNCAIGTQLLK